MTAILFLIGLGFGFLAGVPVGMYVAALIFQGGDDL